MKEATRISATISPEGSLEVLSQQEVNRLRDTSSNGMHDVLRRCALAILNYGTMVDDSCSVLETYHDFDIEVIQQDRAPETQQCPGACLCGWQHDSRNSRAALLRAA